MGKQYLVARLEGEYAVCEDENFKSTKYAKIELPKGIKEGDVLDYVDGRFSINRAKTQERRQETKKQLENLFN